MYFCAEIPEPLFRGMVAVKGVAADTDAQTDARTTVRREAHASVWPDGGCVPGSCFHGALFGVFCYFVHPGAAQCHIKGTNSEHS